MQQQQGIWHCPSLLGALGSMGLPRTPREQEKKSHLCRFTFPCKSYPCQSKALQNQVHKLPFKVASAAPLVLFHPPPLQHSPLSPLAFCLSLPRAVASGGWNGKKLSLSDTEVAKVGPRCRQAFSPAAPLLFQPSQTPRGPAASISQGCRQWLCQATLLSWGKQGGYFLCLSLNSVSKHSPHTHTYKNVLGRIDLCTILHLPNGLTNNCWMSQMQKGSWILCMEEQGLAFIYFIYHYFPPSFSPLTSLWPVS